MKITQSRETWLKAAAIFFALWLGFDLVARFAAEILWFREVDYLEVFWIRVFAQTLLWSVSLSISWAYLWGNLTVAKSQRWKLFDDSPNQDKPFLPLGKERQPVLATAKGNTLAKPSSPSLTLPWLLLIVLLLILVVVLIIIYVGQTTLDLWQPSFNLAGIRPTVPSFGIWSRLPNWLQEIWQLGATVAGVLLIFLLLAIARIWLKVLAVVLSLVFAGIIAGHWAIFLQFLAPTSFGKVDPQFGLDISFYVFKLPVYRLLTSWLTGLAIYALASVSLTYLLSGRSLSEGKFPGFSGPQLRHLLVLAGVTSFTLGINHWLRRYELLFSKRGVTYGASYTDVNVELPLEIVLTIVAMAIAVWLFYSAWRSVDYRNLVRTRKLWLPLSMYLVILAGGSLTIFGVQRLVVQPNELSLETPYILRSIAATRDAFDLNDIEARTFNPQDELTAADIRQNDSTIDNIRLWDTKPLLQTNRQLQQIRLYYRFHDADIDRYLIPNEANNDLNKQQVIISARELDYEDVPQTAKTWVNKHLVYTHGYGYTLSPVNLVEDSGLPFYFVKDIGSAAEAGELTVSSEAIRAAVAIDNPRIYYGEVTNNYVMTDTKVGELDFPSGEDNVYNRYDGSGGIYIGDYVRRILFAEYLKDWQMLFTQNFTRQTRLLFRRDIAGRITTIAPFLRYDRDPYLVAADTEDPDSHLYWIVDAYTISDRYPYSDPGENNFNYIRNSVKVLIDAYNGNASFYVADASDPIIRTWNRIFPDLLQPLSQMPASLRFHIRYPEDFFSTQSERLLTYHMTDPQVFYNREDQWQIPQEIYGTETQPVEPYYLIMKLPTATGEEFILLHPYTPTSRPNLIAWLAARSDGINYGRLLLYKFPKQKLVYGPRQIEALINQDPVISQQISLWNREGSRVIQGNLLIIPIEQSLLYVEPLYLEAEENSLPTLARVIVVYGNRIVMAETLEESLEGIFAPEDEEAPAIIRPIDEVLPPS